VKHKVKQKAHAEFCKWAATYDTHWLNRFLFEPAHGQLLNELGLREQAPAAKPARVLDIGCGTGELAIRLAERGWHAVGLDLCEPMLHRARPKVNGSPGSVRLAVADSEHLPFATGSFDAVTCANSFHHYPHPKAVIREMLRVLRAGGRLIVIDGWPDHWIGRIIYDLVITYVEGGDVRHVESHKMVRLFEGAGFREVTQKRTHALFPLLLTRGIAPGAESATPR